MTDMIFDMLDEGNKGVITRDEFLSALNKDIIVLTDSIKKRLHGFSSTASSSVELDVFASRYNVASNIGQSVGLTASRSSFGTTNQCNAGTSGISPRLPDFEVKPLHGNVSQSTAFTASRSSFGTT